MFISPEQLKMPPYAITVEVFVSANSRASASVNIASDSGVEIFALNGVVYDAQIGGNVVANTLPAKMQLSYDNEGKSVYNYPVQWNAVVSQDGGRNSEFFGVLRFKRDSRLTMEITNESGQDRRFVATLIGRKTNEQPQPAPAGKMPVVGRQVARPAASARPVVRR